MKIPKPLLNRLAIPAPIDIVAARVADFCAFWVSEIFVLVAGGVAIEEVERGAGVVAGREVVKTAARTGEIGGRDGAVVRCFT